MPTTETSKGRVVAPLDGSKNADRAFQQAVELAKQTDRDVYAIYVIDTPRLTSVIPPDQVSTFWAEGLMQQGECVLDEAREYGRQHGVKVDTKLIVGFPEEEILKAAEPNDFIIMGCKGRTALDRMFLGSVCENVVHHAKGPVMVVH